MLIITAALKAELPINWLHTHNIPILSYQKCTPHTEQVGDAGIVVVITGVGVTASEACARWIAKNWPVLYVVNIGSAGGIAQKRHWVTPVAVATENGASVKIDVRLPFDWTIKRQIGGTLLTVAQPVLGTLPEKWKQYQFLDMEAAAQAQVFKQAGIAFHLVKYVTDDSSQTAKKQFKAALKQMRYELQTIFSGFVDIDEPITVIIPVYNRAHCIGACLQSVLKQTLAPQEIIVVDDASKDDLATALKPFRQQITLIQNEKNKGVSHARNLGIQRAKTPWVAFLDSDDLWQPEKLANQWAFHRRYPFYQISQNGEMWIRNGVRVNPKQYHAKPKGWIWSFCLHRCLISPSAVMINKKLLAQVGLFDESLPACEDYELWLRITRDYVVGLVDDLTVVKYGGHDDQLSRRYTAMDQFRVQALLKALDNEKNPEFQTALIAMIRKKATILLKGYKKRQNQEEVKKYERLLSTFN